jgi:hypothetical protein
VSCHDAEDAKAVAFHRILHEPSQTLFARESLCSARRLTRSEPLHDQSILKVDLDMVAAMQHAKTLLQSVEEKTRLVILGVMDTKREPPVLDQLVLVHPQVQIQVQIPRSVKGTTASRARALQELMVTTLRFSRPYVVHLAGVRDALTRAFGAGAGPASLGPLWLSQMVDWHEELYRACPLLAPRTTLAELVLWLRNQVWNPCVPREAEYNAYHALLQDAARFADQEWAPMQTIRITL